MLNTSILIRLLVLCLLEPCGGQDDYPDYGIPQSRAAIEPVDSLVFVGETLKLQCSMTDLTFPVSPEDMYFELTSHGKNLTWIVPKENVTVVDRGIFANVTITDDYSYFTSVSCLSKHVSELLASVYIHAEKPIKNITNLSAVYYYNKDLELTWSLGEKYLCDDCINVTVDYSASVPPNEGGYPCEEQTKESCQFRVYGQDIIFVRIVVEYDRHNLRPSSEFLEPLYDRKAVSVSQINVTDHMKTQPPGNLRNRDINSTCAELSWDEPLYFSSCECEALYVVTITEINNKSNTWTELGVRAEGQDYITICSLSPFTTYKLSVQIKASEINPWSEPAITEVTTDEARPLTGPPLTPTSYHVDDCVDNKAEVTVYWNDPLKSSLQGELTRFEVVVDDVTTLLRKGSNYYKTKLDCDVEHHVLVYSATAVGTSLSPSNISIPRNGTELSAVNNVMVRMEEEQASSATEKSVNVTVTWDLGLLAERNVTLILYMCQAASVPYTCFNDFSTTEISVAKTEMRLQDLEASVSLFGYALVDDQGRKRGIQWINCVYRAEEFPKKPDPVNVNVGRSTNTLEISWTSRRCDRETKVLILRYHLFICRQKVTQQRDLQLCRNTTVNSSKSNYVAEDLTGGSTYYAYIQAESPAGLGPLSKPTPGVPAVANSNPQHMLEIVMGTLLLMMFASIVVIIFVRLCLKSQKKTKTLAVNKYDIFENETQTQHQVINGSKPEIVTNWAPALETPLDHPVVPPALEFRRTVDLTQQILSEPTPSVATGNNMADDTKMNYHKDKVLSIATDMDTSEPQLICLQDVSEVLEMPDLPGEEPGCLHHSDSATPYVKMTNECFSLGSENQTVATDEGYNSPEADIDSPVFSLGTPQIQWTGVSSVSPLFMNGIAPILPPHSQNVFTCTGFSEFPSQSKKVLPDLPFSSTQTEISKTDSSVNSPQSQISETNLSNIVSSVILHPNCQQPLNSLKETILSPKPTISADSSIIHVYNVSSHLSCPVQSLPPHSELPHTASFQDSIAPTTTSLDSNPLAVVNLDSNPPPKSYLCCKNNPELNVYDTPDTSLPVRPQKEFSNKNKETAGTGAGDFTENRSDLSQDDHSDQQILSGCDSCAIDGVVNFQALGAGSEHESSTDSETVFSHYKPNCQTSPNLATPDGSHSSSGGYKSLEFLETSAKLDLGSQGRIGTLREDFVDQGRIGTLREDFVEQGRIGTLREDFVDQGRIGTLREDFVDQGRIGTLREDFVDQGRIGTLGEDFVDQGRIGTLREESVDQDRIGTLREEPVDQDRIGTLREESVDQDRFGTHTTNYVGKRRFVDQLLSYKENFDDQNGLPDCGSDIVGNHTDGIDSYVTCAVNGEVNFEKLCFHPQYEPVDSLNRYPDYTPNCLTNIPLKDAFLENESDYSQIICGDMGQRSLTEADKDDSQGSCGEYKGLSFLEHSPDRSEAFGIQREDCIRQAACGEVQESNFGNQGEFEMHNMNIPKEVWFPIENSDSVYVRPDVTHKELNLVGEKFTLKPVHVGNNAGEHSEVFLELTISGESSFERDDLDNTSADATLDNALSEGGYVSQAQLCALAQLNVSHC